MTRLTRRGFIQTLAAAGLIPQVGFSNLVEDKKSKIESVSNVRANFFFDNVSSVDISYDTDTHYLNNGTLHKKPAHHPVMTIRSFMMERKTLINELIHITNEPITFCCPLPSNERYVFSGRVIKVQQFIEPDSLLEVEAVIQVIGDFTILTNTVNL